MNSNLLTKDRQIVHDFATPRSPLAADIVATSARIHRLREQLRRAESLRDAQLQQAMDRHDVPAGPDMVAVGGTDIPACHQSDGGTGILPVIPASAAHGCCDPDDRSPYPPGHIDSDWDGLS